MTKKITRSSFIKMTGLGALSLAMFPSQIHGMSKSLIKTIETLPSNKKLILIRLNGGNDGLNTIVPLNSYSNLKKARPDIILPFNSLHKLGNHPLGLHPEMGDIAKLFEEKKVTVINGVSIERNVRSHFKATDLIATNIRDRERPDRDTGFLGRYFDNIKEVNGEEIFQDPAAISVGTSTSKTCDGEGNNYSHVSKLNTENQSADLQSGSIIKNGTYAADHVQFLDKLARDSNRYDQRINEALEKGYSNQELYNMNDAISVACHKIVKCITGGLQTNVYIINIGGFDTHGLQVEAGDPTKGRHAELWKKINDALYALIRDLEVQVDHNGTSYLNHVLTMFFTEFGRRIAQNGSFGTDHGDASAIMLLGSCFNKQVIGDIPIIDSVVDSRDGLPMSVDIRHVSQNVLVHYFKALKSEVISNFDISTYRELDIFGCDSSTDDPLPSVIDLGTDFAVHPNPARDFVYITGYFQVGLYIIKIYNLQGTRLLAKVERFFTSGEIADFRLSVGRFITGVYLVELRFKSDPSFKKTFKLIKK